MFILVSRINSSSLHLFPASCYPLPILTHASSPHPPSVPCPKHLFPWFTTYLCYLSTQRPSCVTLSRFTHGDDSRDTGTHVRVSVSSAIVNLSLSDHLPVPRSAHSFSGFDLIPNFGSARHRRSSIGVDLMTRSGFDFLRSRCFRFHSPSRRLRKVSVRLRYCSAVTQLFHSEGVCSHPV